MWSPVTAVCRKLGTAWQLQAHAVAPAATTHWSYSVLVAKYSKCHDTATWLQCSTQGCVTPEKAGRTSDKQHPKILDSRPGLQPTTMASVNQDTQATTMASITLDTQPTTMASVTLDTQPTTEASVTLDTHPTTMASVTLDTQPTTEASVTLDTQPTTMDSVTLDTQPTTMASDSPDTQPAAVAHATHRPDGWGGDCDGHAPPPSPPLPPPTPLESHNVAPFVSASPGLRRLVALGVDVSGWERRPGLAQFVVRLDFERDMQRHLLWLHDVGMPADQLGGFLSENPLIFKERLDDLQVRVNYLKAKRFSPDQVTRIVSHNPFWLMFSTERIDRRLGFFSQMFHLKAAELRRLATRCPVIITSNLFHVKVSQFTIKEEFGFTSQEMKEMLLEKPGLWMLSRRALQERLQFLHNTMGLSHRLIAGSPGVLTYRAMRVRQRHLMLHMLGRHQYDKSQPGYVSLDSLVGTTDEEFCCRVAKVPVATYNEFLKTL